MKWINVNVFRVHNVFKVHIYEQCPFPSLDTGRKLSKHNSLNAEVVIIDKTSQLTGLCVMATWALNEIRRSEDVPDVQFTSRV